MKKIKKIISFVLAVCLISVFPITVFANNNQMSVYENLISDVDCYNMILKYDSDDYFLDIAFNEVSQDKTVNITYGDTLTITTDSGTREKSGGTGNTIDEAKKSLHWYYGNDNSHVVCTNKAWSFTLVNDNDSSDVINGSIDGFGSQVVEADYVDFDSHYSINQTLSATGLKVGTYTARLDYNYQLKYNTFGWNDEDVIDSYVEFKVVVGVNTEAYDKAIARSNAIIAGKNSYTPLSFTNYKVIVDDVIQRRKKVTTQEELDALTTELLSAESVLVENTVVVRTYTVDSNGDATKKGYASVDYGTNLVLDSGKDSVVKWVVEEVGNPVSQKQNSTSGTLTISATSNSNVYAVLEDEDSQIEYSRLVFYTRDNRIQEVKYVEKGTTFDTSTVVGVDIPFYEFFGWDITSITATQDEYTIRAVYKAK